ncbi:3-oxoacyl-[acyl-carrier-protein] synthase III C-terminal domain-containing protein [Salinarimonas sp.]|uniref:3-oxoacyl-[acyl-carrier-protein] synthase III C-terminal domain-containing protein n=1 Tax=Salinarimonas sp. TaxID=2766526 RepID=UPI0032D97B08
MEALFTGCDLPYDPDLLGLDRYFVADEPLARTAALSAGESLAASDLDPHEIDALLLCATRIAGEPADHARLIGDIARTVGVSDAWAAGVTAARCAGLMAGLRMAEGLVASGHRHVLLVAADAAHGPQDRLRPFALFSDGAASCVLSARDARRAGSGFDLIAMSGGGDVARMDEGARLSAELNARVDDMLLRRSGTPRGGVRAVMPTNVFRPVLAMSEIQGGWAPEQLYLDNVARCAHCFAADPIVNLADYARAETLAPGDRIVLAGSVPGLRISAMLAAATGAV